jgi:hypothetical protein
MTVISSIISNLDLQDTLKDLQFFCAYGICVLYQSVKEKICIILGKQMCDFNTNKTQGASMGYITSSILKRKGLQNSQNANV